MGVGRDREHPEPPPAHGDDVEAPVGQLGDLTQLRRAADRVELLRGDRRLVGRALGVTLGGGDLPAVPQGHDTEFVRFVVRGRDEVAHERAVPLLEDVQGQHQAGKEHRAQREDRDNRAHGASVSAR
jgi:hypothetical protein